MHNLKTQKSNKEIFTVTLIGFIVNVFLTILKFFAGFIGKSSAMIADAVHSLSDLISDIIILFFVRISTQPVDENHRYGHGKFETFSTFVVGLILVFVAFGILWDSLKNILAFLNGFIPQSPDSIALWAALLSIIVKEVLFWYTYVKSKKNNSQILLANAWHHRSDSLTSVATFIGIGGAILFGGKWTILDPIAAGLVSLFILRIAYKIVIRAANDLLEKSLPQQIRTEIFEIISNVKHVKNPHGLRTRRIGSNYAIEIHVCIQQNMSVKDSHDVTLEVENLLKERFGQDTHVVIHVDPLS